MNSIETHQLSFSYKKQPILSNLNLEVPKGSIYGYLGENGSGKTTTIRLLAGLLGNKHRISICGCAINNEKLREKAFSKVGLLISPCFLYEHFSCIEHFNYLNQFYQNSQQQIDWILDKIGLAEIKQRKVKDLSSGMKQRLAIGLTLINDPELLILDEPINGLDPFGIKDIREVLVELNQTGKTIFISSHILSELEKTVTHIGILHQGKLLFQGTLNELKNQAKTEDLETCYVNLITQKHHD
jgi:ABC-2 type transport system ATP-binding protein